VVSKGLRFMASNAIGVLALFIALGGVGYAATGGFTAGGRLQACVNEEGGIKLLKAGKHCKRGQKTVAWNQTGPSGTNGASGASGAAGASGSNGANGTTGFTSTLPPGKTEVGTWATDIGTESSTPLYVPISFNIPLEENVGVSIMDAKAPPTDECPGTAADPQAAPGNLCIYAGQLLGGTLFQFDPGIANRNTYGTIVGVKRTASSTLAYGTWAVTAE
jgi:hypothetical protein